MNTEIRNSNYTTQEKLQILADAAKYDVACTSSGSSRRGKKGELGNAEACGICHILLRQQESAAFPVLYNYYF